MEAPIFHQTITYGSFCEDARERERQTERKKKKKKITKKEKKRV